MSKGLSLSAKLKLNTPFLRSACAIGLAVWLWEQTNRFDFELRFIAVVLAIGGAKQLVIGLWQLSQHLGQQRTLAQFQKQGAKPKADTMANEDTLRANGLLK